MSLEQVKKAAAEQQGPYVVLPVSTYAAALTEAGEHPVTGSFAEHVAGRMKINPDAAMHAHRDVHLCNLLAVKDPAVTTPAVPSLES